MLSSVPAGAAFVLHEIADGTYEAPLLAACESVMHKDDIILEAGGGFGYMATRLAPQCRGVWSVEATYEYWRALKDNTLDLNVMPLWGILAPPLADPQMPFYRSPDFRYSSSLPHANTVVEVAPVLEIDDLLRSSHATVLVLDIEGLEHEILEKSQCLGQLRAIVVEWHLDATSYVRMRETECRINDIGFTTKYWFPLPFPRTPVGAYVAHME